MAGRWPNVERHIIDWLGGLLGCTVSAPGQHAIGSRLPAVIVERGGGGGFGDGVQKALDIEVTVVATSRTKLWDLVASVEDAFEQINPGHAGPIFIDEASPVFGFSVDPDRGTSGHVVASATWALVVRPH